MIKISHKGKFTKTTQFLKRARQAIRFNGLEEYGQEGVNALMANTPKETGKTANSWHYKIEKKEGLVTVSWYNTNVDDGCSIALIIQYGHGTKDGAWIDGIDYINPSLKPIFNKMAEKAWGEVTKK